jgi:TFIIF-interacting CTD phosphatase-like protein
MSSSPDRMNVLLDLDNTIINALEEHEREKIAIEFQNQFDYKDMLGYGMRVYARPGLPEFLDFLFEHFNVSVFTAAEQEYALFIVNNFLLTKPKRKVHHILFRYHVDIGLQRYNGMKDLRLLWHIFKLPNFYPCNTVIVDDLDDVRTSNPDNTIVIKAFDVAKDGKLNVESVTDTDLKRVEAILTKLNQRYKNSVCPRQIFTGRTPDIQSPFLV